MTNNTQPQLPAEVVHRILKCRDALVMGDRDEAYHQLYAIASPAFDKYFPWDEMEKQISYPRFNEEEIKANREVTEYATKLLQAKQLLHEVLVMNEMWGDLPGEFINKVKTFLDGK